jgi:hypothetical protein
MVRRVSDAEIKAYSAGYKAAMQYLEALLERWSQSEETHASCSCRDCRKLREIAQGNSFEKEIKAGSD